MGVYLNQLPPTEVARLKAELAETLIAHFCYPRFYDYRINELRTRPVDRAKRQEVWQYLNAVDFNVWGRVDVDSPDFQRQVERLFIHFVQRNRSFFGEQGRKRMADVRALITSCSTALADGLRTHLLGKQENPPFGSPRPVSSWSAPGKSGQVELAWEQILASTMQLQQQLLETRKEAAPVSAVPSAATMRSSISPRRARPSRFTANGATGSGNGLHEGEGAWSATENRPVKPGEVRASGPFSAAPKEAEPARAKFPSSPNSADALPTMPLPLSKAENTSAGISSTARPEVSPGIPARQRRGRQADAAALGSTASSMVLSHRSASQPLPSPNAAPSALPIASATPGASVSVKQSENPTVLVGDEDVVIFEQLRYQLVVWLKVEAVHLGIEQNGQGAFQLIEALRREEGVDMARLQVVSTLLNMCDQITTSGRATLFDYRQAMMFYLMHTRGNR
jgi:hypothetical protein